MKNFEDFSHEVPNKDKYLKKLNELLNDFNNANSEVEAFKVYQKIEKVNRHLSTLFSLISVRFTIDTKDPKNIEAKNVINEIGPYFQEMSTNISKALLESKYRPYLEKKLGSYLFVMLENELKTFDPKIIPMLIEENNLVDKYDSIIASCEIDFDGGIKNMSQMRKYFENKDRNIRKKASELYYAFCMEKREEIGQIYDELVHLRDKMAHELGFNNYVELGYLRLGRTDYNAFDVAAYREQILKNVTPIAKKIEMKRRERIGIKNPYAYDMSINYLDGNPAPKGNKDYLVEQAKKMYKELSYDTDVFFNFLNDHHLMDLEAKPGKQSGGYMTTFPEYECPFIFSNFNGTSGDVDVLTHEFGHAFQSYESRKIKIEMYQSPTLESCEIHSMSMEFFAYPWMNLFFDDDARYKESHLSDAISFLPYGVTVDEFQHFVYENPNATPEERCKKWLEIEKKYTPYKSNKGSAFLESGARWMLQGHIFGSPFYYIDYTLAQVLAFQFFNEDRENHEDAWNKYVKLCKLGGKYPFKTLMKKAHLKLPFNKGVVKKSVKPLLEVLNLK